MSLRQYELITHFIKANRINRIAKYRHTRSKNSIPLSITYFYILSINIFKAVIIYVIDIFMYEEEDLHCIFAEKNWVFLDLKQGSLDPDAAQ